jgi:Xaa-Pro aminopeptidase
MLAQLQQSGGGVLLVPSATGSTAGGTFRQENDFLYFTGLELPQSLLVLDAEESRSMVYAPRTDARFASATRPNDFPGRRLQDDPEIAGRSGIEQIRPIEDLEAYLAGIVADGRTLRVNLGRPGAIPIIGTGLIQDWTAATGLLHHVQTAYPDVPVQNAFTQVARLRMIKSEAEIALIRTNAGLTAHAIMAAAPLVAGGMDERGLEAEFEASCKRGGSQRLAFSSIIKSGPNSLWPWRILAAHYDRRNRVMREGELVIFDVGCELDYYSSDVGRTFPVSGEFTDYQREILEMSTAVADSIIAATRPGITLRDLQAIAESVIPEEHKRFMQTGLFFGHHIGLAVGDPSLADVTLEPGMIFTVEPWYYNHEREISVFVEDDILVTPTGAEVLTASLPRAPADLERLVGARR